MKKRPGHLKTQRQVENMRKIFKQNLFQNPVFKDIAWIASIAVIYFIVGNLSLELLFEPEGIAAIWPNSGIFLSAILLTRRKILPYLIGTLFITDLIIEMLAGSPFNVSLVYAFALTFDASFSAWLLTRFTGGAVTFDRVKHVFGFIALSVIFSNAISATIASLAPYLLLGESFWNSWALWWSSDAVGNLLITPFVMSLVSMDMARLWKSDIKRVAEAVLFFVSIITMNFLALQRFGGNIDQFYIINYLTFPFLIWAAIRFGIRGVTFASVVLTANILYFILRGQILPLSGSLLNSVIMVQLYIAIISISSLILASVYSERKRAGEDLQVALIKYKTLFNAFPLGITVADQAGNILESNPMAETLLGLSQEEQNQRKIDGKEWTIVRPDGTPLPAQEYASVRALRENRIVENMEMGIVKTGSEITWINVTAAPLPLEGYGVVITYNDITRRKEAEAELHLLNQTLKAAQNMAKVGYWSYDIKTKMPTWSEQMFVVFGVDPGNGVPHYDEHREIWHPDDWELFNNSVQECEKGKPYNIVVRIIFPDKSTHYINTQGFPRYNEKGEIYELFGTSQDITEHKLVEEELRKHREHLEELVKERTAEVNQKNEELEKFNKFFVGRELKMIELKKKIAELEKKIASPVKEE